MEFSGAVLAGGRSGRMGSSKAGLKVGGSSFLEIQLNKLLSAGVEDLMVSVSDEGLGPLHDIDLKNVRIVPDVFPGRGPLAALASVLKAAAAPYCVILSVDAVLVKPQTISDLMETAEESGRDIVLLASENGHEPLIGVYRTTLAGEAEALLADGRSAVRTLFGSHEPLLLLKASDDPELLNCNTPEDYIRVLEIHNNNQL